MKNSYVIVFVLFFVVVLLVVLEMYDLKKISKDKLMIKIFNLKHWQMFLLVFVCGIVVCPSPYKEVFHSISIITFSIWIYAIGFYSQQKIQQLKLTTMNIDLFRFNIIFVVFALMFGFKLLHPLQIGLISLFTIVQVFVKLFYSYFFFALFQSVLFVSKAIVKIDYKREVSFSDYFDYAFKFFFFPITIWALQPELKKLFSTEETIVG